MVAFKGVTGFGSKQVGPGVHKIVMYGSEHEVKKGYTEGKKDKVEDKVKSEEKSTPHREGTTEDSDKILKARKKFNISKDKNIATFEGEIDGKKIELVSYSGQNRKPGTVDPVNFEDQVLKTQPTKSDKLKNPDVLDRRAYDSESKGFEKLLGQTKPESVGKIKIISELNLCGSCADVVDQFRKLRPNIEIDIVYTKPYSNPL